jgi:adenine-specific DNA-methyltransferase
VVDYRHKNEKRKNNPDAGLATYNYKPLQRVKYSHDPHVDPQLIWAGKSEGISFDVETVSLHIHERVSTKAILESIEKSERYRQLGLFAEPDLPFDKRIEFYQHEMDWTNRLILGDSLLVMNSLLEREMMAGKIQMIYMDPPYGIAYNSNFQPFIGSRDVKDGDDSSLSREPEQIKAYRDTWTLGIHSYLTYLRDRLLLCRQLLHESGSCFVQISDQNLHLVRSLMDEIFGAENFVATIAFKKTGFQASALLPSNFDYLCWYAKDKSSVKYHQLNVSKLDTSAFVGQDLWLEEPDGSRRRLTKEESADLTSLPEGYRVFRHKLMEGAGASGNTEPFEFEGRLFRPKKGKHWSTNPGGMTALAKARRLIVIGNSLRFVNYLDDFPVTPITTNWVDTVVSGFSEPQMYAVQTSIKVVERCVLMTTDPGDLVFDPTCGSGTAAYCAERYGRRWITCDTSRVALALARQRLMTAVFRYYKLANPERGVDADFLYETVSHLMLKSIARGEPGREEKLYGHPIEERDKVRVSGPFSVEAIPAPVVEETFGTSPKISTPVGVASDYVNEMIELLRKSGVNFAGGRKMMLENLCPISSGGLLHAEGEATQNGGKVRVAVSLGPRYGPITAKQVDEAIRSSYKMGFDMLVFAGFAFDPEAQATIQKNPIPKLGVQMAHISPDVIVGAYSDSPLLKTTKTSQLFTVFGEPDVKLEKNKDEFTVRLHGVDLYDPTTGEVHSSNANEIPAWFLDEDYDGYTFRIRQAFFPKEATAKNPWDKLENALRGLVDKEKMEKFRGTESLPFKAGPQQQIAVKVIDNRGNEVMVVKSLNGKEEAT